MKNFNFDVMQIIEKKPDSTLVASEKLADVCRAINIINHQLDSLRDHMNLIVTHVSTFTHKVTQIEYDLELTKGNKNG